MITAILHFLNLGFIAASMIVSIILGIQGYGMAMILEMIFIFPMLSISAPYFEKHYKFFS